MDERVTSFPFNILENPMYIGSAMSFFGTSFWFGKPIGFLLSLEVTIMYAFAMSLEGPFTAKIYTMRDEYLMRKVAKHAEEKEE
jgi:phosphatidylethanolamine/phosphatidyl-N-methylethanolamine N-methyltransferase